MSDWETVAKKKGFRPLAIYDDEIIGVRKGVLSCVDFRLQETRVIGALPCNSIKHILGNTGRLLERLLRTEPTASFINKYNKVLYISRRSEVYKVNLNSWEVQLDFMVPDQRKVLSFEKLNSKSFGRMIVFGEYFGNPDRSSVRIWGRPLGSGHWRVLYEFPPNVIEHIHAIKQIGESVYILCGDVGDAASIWKSDSDFTMVECCCSGSQLHRAAWLEDISGRLIYATDSQFEQNYVMELSGSGITKPMFSIGGSSIYVGRSMSDVFFSTTVEGDSTGMSKIQSVLNRKPGSGILSNIASIHSINGNIEMSLIYSGTKDWVPFYLGQFGTFIFPAGEHPSHYCIAYGIGLADIDGVCLSFRRVSV